MGAVNFSIDKRLVECIKQELDLKVFVETGTFEGGTIERIANLFESIYSVELAQEYFYQTQRRFADVEHVKLSLGDSAYFLNQRCPKLSLKNVLYWLDAHWCNADDTGGQDSQCPLLSELGAIVQLNTNSVIMIDDARLFLCAPPALHRVKQWPRFQQIIDALNKLSATHELMVINDVILFHPPSITQTLTQYAHDHGVDWLHTMNQSKKTDALEYDARDDVQSIYEQLVEKEAVIQNLIKQLANHSR